MDKDSLKLRKLAGKINNIPKEFCNGNTNEFDINKVNAMIRNYGGSGQ